MSQSISRKGGPFFLFRFSNPALPHLSFFPNPTPLLPSSSFTHFFFCPTTMKFTLATAGVVAFSAYIQSAAAQAACADQAV
jgi:hypothetical protein